MHGPRHAWREEKAHYYATGMQRLDRQRIRQGIGQGSGQEFGQELGKKASNIMARDLKQEKGATYNH